MSPLGAAHLGLAGLGVAGLETINLGASPSRRPKDYAPSPSHHSATDPQTPQTPQHPLKAANISKRPQSNSKKPPHRIGRHQIDVDKGVGLLKKARPSVGVMALWPSLFRAGQHARNQTGILDRSGDKPAGLRLRCALHKHAKNNGQ